MSDSDKEQYDQWLDLPNTILGVNQGRHDATKFKINCYYWKYSGEWLDLRDDQRFERAWEWHIAHCKPPRPREEFDRICKWTVDKFQAKRDELHNRIRNGRRHEQTPQEFDKSHTFAMYHDNVKASLDKNIWTEIGKNPIRWIVANSRMRVVYKAHQDAYEIITKHGEEVKEKAYKLTIDNFIICCIPLNVVKHESPLDFLQKETNFTIPFKDTVGKTFTLVRKTIEQIMNYLKSEGYVMPGYGATEALAAIITAFREDKKLEIDKTINTMGLYWIDNELVPVGLDEYLNNYSNGSLTIEKKKETIEFIEELVTRFRPGVVSTALKIGVVSPAEIGRAHV